ADRYNSQRIAVKSTNRNIERVRRRSTATPSPSVDARAARPRRIPSTDVPGRSGNRGRRARGRGGETTAISALHAPQSAPDLRPASRQALGDQLAHVLDREGLLRAQDLPSEVHHGEAERAGG